MNILFLDAYFEPEQIAFTHLEKDLIHAFVEAGHRIHVICPSPTRGISGDIAKAYKNRKSEVLYNGSVRVTRFTAPQEGKNPLIRALRYFWCNLRTYQISTKQKDIDAIFANSTPPTQGWIAGKAAKKMKVPFIYSLQDIFPDSLVNAGMTREGSLIWRIGRKVENYSYRHAKKIIVISEDFKENIMAKGVPEEKITVISNWADTGAIIPIPRKENKIIQRYHLDPEKTFITYSGNIGMSQNMDLLLDTAKRLINELPNLQFIIIGDGVDRERVQKRVTDESITNIVMLPFQPYEDIAHVFYLGDIGLIISKKGIGSNSVPSKTWGYMAAGKPILASFDRNSELYNIISNEGCGICAEAEDIDEFIQAIRSMIHSENLRRMGESGRRYIEKTLSPAVGVEKYVNVIERVVL